MERLARDGFLMQIDRSINEQEFKALSTKVFPFAEDGKLDG